MAMHYLTMSVLLLRRYLHALLQHPTAPVRCPVGVSRWAEHVELLGAVPGSEIGRGLLLGWMDTLTVPRVLPPDCAGVLLLGRGLQRGQARGVVHLPTAPLAPLDGLRLVGPGMLTISLRQESLPEQWIRLVETADAGPTRRWARTMGALGREVWQRLIGLRYALIGAGRTGSGTALALARLGVGHLTLIDPDRLERHNVGEMLGVTDADCGRLKVDVLADALAAMALTPANIVPVPASITRLQALHAAQACDVLVSCVDHDSARLAAMAIATVFCKPLLDIATGVHGHGPARQMGADVRLVLPGRCLLCFGGLRNAAEARQVLTSAEMEGAFYAQRDWQCERAGSLASLNQCAVGVALRLLEDLMAERVQDSTWAHLEFDALGRLAVSYPVVPPANEPLSCRLCSLTGWGEEGLSRVAQLFRQGHD